MSEHIDNSDDGAELEEIRADAVGSIVLDTKPVPAEDNRPVLKPRRVAELTADDKPLIPLPPDTQADVYYNTTFEPRCVLCRSPWRERAEHWYLANKQKPNSVVNFFLQYFNAQVSWECVKTHMEHHCRFNLIGNSGLRHLAAREDDMAEWRFRELDLAITGILTEIDLIGGIQCSGKPDMQLKRSTQLERLYSKLVDFKAARDKAAAGLQIDIFSVLMEIYQSLDHPDSKKILLDKVKSLREKLA